MIIPFIMSLTISGVGCHEPKFSPPYDDRLISVVTSLTTIACAEFRAHTAFARGEPPAEVEESMSCVSAQFSSTSQLRTFDVRPVAAST